MKKFLSTLTGKIALVFAILFLGLLIFLAFWNIKVFWIALAVLVFFVIAWFLLDLAVRRWRARKQAAFDEGVAAKEGIDDRRREWTNWTAELKKQGIDRYELPFYLLVGEPQSGKSILLQNSDLHFPFGQSRLSGVGGTRGCDWWFTDEAVVLDLAGRLFTHEGGRSDEAEWEAFLDLLGNFRPQCPANGVLLVIPCDGLLKDTPQQAAAKASKIQSALRTLTGRMQARLPVYLVLTKADKIFGFAESVHRLDAPKRHEMFGWSRPAERFEAPFELAEVREAFERLVDRARLLRANEMVNARIPEHLPQVDRLFAFPSELSAIYPTLEIYLQRIFSESSLVERLFFRGFYLTSGLQTGAPIAKVCAEIFGASGEADVRNLEALFTKQHGYFIKDLVRKRVFTERGLVRPTRKRAVSARRNAVLGYGVSGVFAALTVVYAVYFFIAHEDEGQAKVYQTAVDSAQNDSREWPKILAQLTDVDAAVGHKIDLDKDVLTGLRGSLGNLYASVYDYRLLPAMRSAAEQKVLAALRRGSANHVESKASLAHALDLLDENCSAEKLNAILAGEPVTETSAGGQPTLTLAQALERRKTASDAPIQPSKPGRTGTALTPQLAEIAKLAQGELDGVLDPGRPWHADGDLGFAIVSQRMRQLYEKLRRGDVSDREHVFDDCDEYMRLMREQQELAKQLGRPLEELKLKEQLDSFDGDASDRKRLQERAGVPLAPAAQRLPLEGFLNEVWTAASKAPPPSGALVNVPAVPGLRKIALSDAVFDAGQNSDLVKRILSTAPDALGPEAYRRADLGKSLRALREEIKRDKNEAAEKLLTTKCLALQDRFVRDCPTLEACVEHGLVTDPERWQGGLIASWVDLHGALADASPTAYVPWMSQIVKLTSDALGRLNKKWNDKTGEQLADDTPLSGWKSFRELAAARAYFAKAGPDTMTTAIDRALPRSLERRGETLVSRWRSNAYPLEDATRTKDILSEIEEQEQEVQRLATADTGLDKAVRTARGEWRRAAGELLASRFGTHASVLEQTWEVKLESSRSDLRESCRRVREITSSDWVDSRLENVRDETALCDFLRPNLKQLQDFPGAEKAASDLVDACFPHRGVEFSKKRWVIKLRQLADELESAAGKRKSDVLLLKLRDLVVDCKPPDDASSDLQGAAQTIAKALHRDLRHNVVAAIRWQYFAELTALFDKDFAALREVFDAKEPSIDGARDSELMQQLGGLLDRKGAFDRLREQYVGEELKNLLRRTDLPFRPESSEPSEEPFLAELAEHWRFDRFLVDLQSFLLPTPDNQNVANAVVALKLSWPGQGEQGALSHNGSYLYFYAPANDKLRVDQVNNVGSSNSLDLPFSLAPGPDKGLAFRWSLASKSTAELDDKDPAARIPSSLAPLLLAWSGKLEANQWVASLPVTVEGETQKADIRLSFPKRALPARVPLPPKVPKP